MPRRNDALSVAPAPGPDAPAGTAAAQGLRRVAAALSDAMARARQGRADGIHDVRTLSRRAGALLSLFAHEVPAADRRRLKETLRALRRATGPTRDLDALREHLAHAPLDADPDGMEALRGRLAARRREARKARARALAGPDVAGLVAALRQTATAAARAPGPPMRVVGLPRLSRTLERALARRAAVVGSLPTARVGALHALRIAVKRARYAAELLAPSFGRPVARHAAAARRLQDGLGRLLDAEATARRLRALARAGAGDLAQGTASRATVAATVSALAAASRAEGREARRALDALCDDVLSPAALRALLDHLAKRAGTRGRAR